jgi:heat-inducible transcriptional repressor
MVSLGEPRTQEELSAQAGRLNQVVRGMTALQIEGKLPDLPPADAALAALAVHLLRRSEEGHRPVFHAGLADMFRQPEFIAPRHGESQMSANERVRQMVDFLSQGQAVERLISGLPPATSVHVVIGGDLAIEGLTEGLRDYSFVLGRYGDEDESSGFLGVVGPTRLEYPRAVTLVRYMSGLMTDLMQAH